MENKNHGSLVSPNELFEAAKRIMLNGKEPETERDWMLIVNFFAANIADGLELSVTKLLCKIYDIPLNEEQIEYIVNKQIEIKMEKKAAAKNRIQKNNNK